MSSARPDSQSRRTPTREGAAPVLVLFDWNGTVMDDVSRAADAANHALEKYGMALTEEDFQLGFTLPLREWFSELGVPDEFTAAAAGEWNRAMEVDAPARDSARGTITALRERGVVTGVVTAAAPGSVRADLLATGLEGLFDLVHTDVEDKESCLKSLRSLGEVAIYVGDTAYDVTSARAAGYTTIAIEGGYQHSSVLAGAGADHHIADLAAVLELARPAGAAARASQRRPVSLEPTAGLSR